MINESLIPHPYASCYPLVSGTLEESLYESIKTNGLRQPLVLWRDAERDCVWIIDGRNRHRALCQLQGGVRDDQVMWCTYQNDEEVRLAVLDYNENRRQMSTAQKSVVAGRILQARAALLSAHADGRASNPEGSPQAALEVEEDHLNSSELSHPPHSDEPPWDLDVNEIQAPQAPTYTSPREVSFVCPPEVRREVAATLGIGAKTAQKGAQVVQRGAPKLVSALEEGLVSVEAAYTLTQLDDDELESVVSLGKKAMRDKAKELKGHESFSKEETPHTEFTSEIEVSRIALGWTERSGDQTRRFDIDVTEVEQIQALLSLLTQLKLRGHHAGQDDLTQEP